MRCCHQVVQYNNKKSSLCKVSLFLHFFFIEAIIHIKQMDMSRGEQAPTPNFWMDVNK